MRHFLKRVRWFAFLFFVFMVSPSHSHKPINCLGLKRGYERRQCLRRSLAARGAVAKRTTSCPAGCNVHGICNEELGRCDCPRQFTGPSCATASPDFGKICASYSLLSRGHCATDLPCFNDCNQRGRCVAGICHCDTGYWGIDCAISWGPDGKPQLLDGKYKPRTTGVKVYIYELPANLTSWFSFARVDRPTLWMLWQRITAAGMRTLDGDEADYYLLPVQSRGTLAAQHLEWSLDYIKRTWPWWSKDDGHRHLVVHTGDMGINDYPGTLRDKLADSFANITWLTHWGLTEDHPFTGWKKAHRPGKDIVIPVLIMTSGFGESPLNPANVAAAQAAGGDLEQDRDGLLFFAGTICGDRGHPNDTTGRCSGAHPTYSMGVRQAVYFHHHQRRDFKLVTRSPTYLQDISSHRFCLAPVGGGHGKRQILVSLMGCVPVLIGDGVLQPFEPELDWSRFSVSVREADIPKLPKKRLRCMAQHFYYTGSLGAALGDDGRYDAFETLMEILRVRRDHPDVAPERYTKVDERFRKFVNCDLDDEGGPPVPLCTQGKVRQFPDRPACDECRFSEQATRSHPLAIAGGLVCCGDPDQSKCPRVWP